MPQTASTTVIEVDTSLLERLRARHPGKADREMIEDIAQIDLGFSMLRQAQERNALNEDEATALARAGLMLPDPVSPAPVLRDPDDDYLLALASTAEAAAIVSGDGDLLEHPDLDPPAITAREACIRFGLIAR
jgi:hypothetical protein